MNGLRNSSQRAYLRRRAAILFLLWSGVWFVMETVTPCAFTLTQAQEKASARTLTFEQRVAYQYAIEEVYWRHRIWPENNPGPKPSLDVFVSQHEVENKVKGYVRKSQLVADQRGWPITAREVQAEMERMTKHTKQPEVLRELFAALGNGPFVIAECLAKPIVAERLASELSVRTNRGDGWASRPLSSADDASRYQFTYKLPEISPLDRTDDSWTSTTTDNAPEARTTRTAVWTGSEMIIWGGATLHGGLNTGGRYNPALDTWTATNITNPPEARGAQSTVWTGREMIVWGGFDVSNELNTGGRYDPITDSWTPTSTTNAPTARADHSAVWTGSEMIIWGGTGCSSNCNFNTGGRYNPATDSWTTTSTVNAPVARWIHRAVWTGSEMIVWGGSDDMNYLHTGGRYDPSTDSWTATSTVNVALGRIGHTAVWTGGEMIVWGGVDETFNDSSSGGRYNPSTDSWLASNLSNAPSPRDSHSAVWTGSEMIVWGGVFCCPVMDFNTGGRYSPEADSWMAISTANVPLARWDHTAVWTGSEMVVWGGFNDNLHGHLNTGGRYGAQAPAPVLQNAISRKMHGQFGIFDIALPLNGTPGVECRSGGSTSDDTIMITFSANVSVTGSPQAAVTSGIGTIGSGGVSNGGTVLVADNLVTIPLTNVANAQTIQVTLYGVNNSTNFTIPMSSLVGDTNGNGRVNAADVSQTKSRVGHAVDGTNFRSDVNANGYIDAADVALVKSSVGTGLP